MNSHKKIHCSRPLLCSSLVFSNVCRQSSTNKGSEVWDMSWRNHDKNTACPLNKARPDMVTAITQWHSPLSLHGD